MGASFELAVVVLLLLLLIVAPREEDEEKEGLLPRTMEGLRDNGPVTDLLLTDTALLPFDQLPLPAVLTKERDDDDDDDVDVEASGLPLDASVCDAAGAEAEAMTLGFLGGVGGHSCSLNANCVGSGISFSSSSAYTRFLG